MPEEPPDAPITLEDIKPVESSAANDTKAQREIDILNARRLSVEIAGLEADIAARQTYASRIYCLVVGWLLGVMVILLLQAFQPWTWHPLPEGVLIALVAGSTISILGILASVVAYIFKAPK